MIGSGGRVVLEGPAVGLVEGVAAGDESLEPVDPGSEEEFVTGETSGTGPTPIGMHAGVGVGVGEGVGVPVAGSGAITRPAGSVPPTRMTGAPTVPLARSADTSSLVPARLVPSM